MFEAIAARWKLAVEIREPACESFIPTYSKIFSETFASDIGRQFLQTYLIEASSSMLKASEFQPQAEISGARLHWNHVSSAKHNPQRFLLLSHGLLMFIADL